VTSHGVPLGNAEGKVVVGVQDGLAAAAALRRGVAEAQQRGCGLHLVRVWREVDRLLSLTRAELARLGESEQQNKLLLERAAWQARRLAPELVVTAELRPGDIYQVLAQLGSHAQLVVLGVDDPGSGNDIARWLAEHVQSPVVLVEPEPTS